MLFSCPGTEASCQRKVVYHRPRDDEDDDDELLRWERSLYLVFYIALISNKLSLIDLPLLLFPVFQAR